MDPEQDPYSMNMDPKHCIGNYLILDSLDSLLRPLRWPSIIQANPDPKQMRRECHEKKSINEVFYKMNYKVHNDYVGKIILAFHGTKTEPTVLNNILENNFQQVKNCSI